MENKTKIKENDGFIDNGDLDQLFTSSNTIDAKIKKKWEEVKE